MNKFREITVKIDKGTGCLVQPTSGDFTYILTAAHVLKDVDKKIKNIKDIKIIWQKIIDGELIDQDLVIIGELYFHSVENKDAAIIKVKKIENIIPLIRTTEKDLDQGKYFLCGHPTVRREKGEKDCFREDEVKLLTEKALGYSEGELLKILLLKDVDGHSGGGILKRDNNLYFIAGIQKGMVMEDGKEDLSKIKFMPLSFFDEIINENKLESLSLSTLEEYYIELINPIFLRQIENNMKILKGSSKERSKKYIKEIYIDHQKLTNSFLSFLDSDSKLFAVIGDSGSGKTNWLCHTVEQQSGEYNCLFFLGTEIRISITDIIKNIFREHYNFLDELCNKKRLIIFIDSIDDLDIPNTRDLIIQFLKDIGKKNIKLVISCKSISWEHYLNLNSDPTLIKEELYTNGYILGELDKNHINEIIDKYNTFYGFNLRFGEKIINWCKKNKFILKLIYETQQNTDATYIDDFTSNFYEKYYDFVLLKFNERRSNANNLLIKICKILFETNNNSIDLNFSNREPNIDINEIYNEFFSFNILIYDEKNNDLRFYFDKFRDYIIAFKSNRWDRFSDEDFANKIRTLNLDNVILESIELYYSLAQISHKRVLDSKAFDFAENYLTLLKNTINENFENLKSRFITDVNKNIGFLGYINLKDNNLLAYSLFETDESEPIKFLIDDEMKYHREKLISLNKAKGSYSLYSLMFKDISKINLKEQVLDRKIKSDIKEFINRGKLEEKNNKFLHIEFLNEMIYSKYFKFFPNFRNSITTIELEELRKIILFESELNLVKINEIYSELGQYALIRGNVKYRNEDFRSFAKRVCDEELNQAEDNLFSMNGLDEQKFTINKIRALKLLNIFQIDNNLLLKINYYFNNVMKMYNSSIIPEIYQIIEEIYGIYLEEYKIIIETNFPTLKSYFKTYSNFPTKYFIELQRELNTIETKYRKFSVKNESSQHNEVTVFDINQISNLDEWNFKFTFKGIEYEAFSINYSSVEDLLQDKNKKGFFPWSNHPFSFNNSHNSIRNLVYKKIEKEFEDAFKYVENK
jgi:hypothetical protein